MRFVIDRRRSFQDDVFSCAGRRRAIGVLTSVALHSAVAAALWRAAPEDLSLLTPQAGRASIALTASLAAASERPSSAAVEIVPTDEAETRAALSPAPPQLLEAVSADLEVPEADTPMRLFAPTEPVVLTVDHADTPVVVGGPAERHRADQEPTPALSEPSAAPQAKRHNFDPEPALPSAVSVPSPASQAHEGVESDAPPQVVVNRPPVYPPDALAAGRTGRVVVRAEVAPDGRVTRAAIHRSSGVPSLDRAALAAVRSWRFSTASQPDAPLRPVNVPIDFVIRR